MTSARASAAASGVSSWKRVTDSQSSGNAIIVATRPWNAALVCRLARAGAVGHDQPTHCVGQAERGSLRQRDYGGVGQGAKQICPAERDERPSDKRQHRDEVVAAREGK